MDKNINNEEKELSLKNLDNYKKNLIYSNNDIIKVYNSIILNCLTHAKKNLNIKNKSYLIYLLKNCIFIINEVFIILLINTNNLDIVVQYAQKAFFYYIEFIGQIGDNNHDFLKLTSNDAKIFVYKKTIFDLIKVIKNNDNIDDYNIIKLKIEIINLVIYSYLNNVKTIDDINFIDELYKISNVINENYNDNIKKFIEYYNNEISTILENDYNINNINYNNILLIQKKIINKLVKKNKNYNIDTTIKKIKNFFLNSNFNFDIWNTKIISKF